jgi:hypothetical protein
VSPWAAPHLEHDEAEEKEALDEVMAEAIAPERPARRWRGGLLALHKRLLQVLQIAAHDSSVGRGA